MLYRSLLPIVPWYYFLFSSDGPWFSAVLFVLYIVAKVSSLCCIYPHLCLTCISPVVPGPVQAAEALKDFPTQTIY